MNKILLEEALDYLIDYRGKTPEKTKSGIPLITAKIIKNGKLKDFQEYISEEGFDDWMSRGIPQKDDVCLTVEAPLGQIAQIPSIKVALGQRIITMRGKEGVLDNNFFKYYCMSKRFQHDLNSRATGTTVIGIKQSELKQISLSLIKYEDQIIVGKFLREIDDKIELNQKMNQTLEEIAKVIFKSWFVDFDPVRAKAEGRPTGLPPEISDLFPDEFVDSEIGEIPKGWDIVPFEYLVDFKNGYAFKSKELSSEIKTDFAVFKMGHIKVGGGFNETYKTDFLTSEVSPKMKESILKTGDVLMCMTDMKSNVRLLGHTALFFDQETEYLVNQRVGLIRAKEDASNYPFLYCLTNENKFLYEIRRNANSGVQVNLSTLRIKNTPTVYPGIEIMRKFGSQMIPVFERIFLSKKENNTLSELRDTLLPKLISGELRIPDAEKFLEEAGI